MELSPKQRNRRFLKHALLSCAGMFMFGFACVPIYRLACAHGYIGRVENVPASAYKIAAFSADETRWVKVQFIGNVNSALKWQFVPEAESIKVHPGVLSSAWFDATNQAPNAIVGNAVPSIAPNKASQYFNKTECFCFTEQVLKPGESRRMPVKFIVDPELPPDINTLTLSYTFYNNELATKKLATQDLAVTTPKT